MPKIKIVSHKTGWNPMTKQGAVHIKLENGKEFPVPIGSAEELSALATLLNEEPLVLITETGYIATPDWEPVGGS